ncbi:MAG TPA: hypothetical protein VGM23_04390, partial [Armatimonadota bacterium]
MSTLNIHVLDNDPPNDWLSTDYATMLRDDVRQYRRVGINGMVSCQTQRTAMPTALAQFALGRYLWNPDVPSDEVIEDY